jgi:hypothetical protein
MRSAPVSEQKGLSVSPTLRPFQDFLVRSRRNRYVPQPPPQDNPPVLQLAPDPGEENFDISFFAFI